MLALQLGLDDVKSLTFCPVSLDICNGHNISYNADLQYVAELILQVECSSVIIKICSTDVWRSKDIFHCECSSQSNFLLNF